MAITKVKRYCETSRGRREKFKGRKMSIMHKAYELWTECEAECWITIRRNGRFYLYAPGTDGQHPPNWDDIVRYLKSVFHFPPDILQIATKYPLPQLLGPENFSPDTRDERGIGNGPLGHKVKDLGEANHGDGRANKIKTEDSDAEDQKCLRNLPTLIELDVSPVQGKVYYLE